MEQMEAHLSGEVKLQQLESDLIALRTKNFENIKEIYFSDAIVGDVDFRQAHRPLARSWFARFLEHRNADLNTKGLAEFFGSARRRNEY